MQQIDAFLFAYKPKYICLSCLAVVTERSEADVTNTIDALIAARRAETDFEYCLNCSAHRLVVRLRA